MNETTTHYVVEKYSDKYGDWEWLLACAARDSLEKSREDRYWISVREPGKYRIVKVTQKREVVEK